MPTTSTFGETLYHILPALYRHRDEGDLARYLEACAVLLDQVHTTLQQRMADNFPDTPLDGSPACQDWLLPYFADLLDVRLVSPLAKARRDELAHAIHWRQGKGTLKVAEAIAQSIGQLEVVVQEGWKRVALTPRLDIPRIPATSYGYEAELPLHPPSMAARHPGLPALSVDLRCPSGAVASTSANPAAEQSSVDGDMHIWRQSSLHGAPCHPGGYDDRSLRTVDLRDPDWRTGHYHPDRLLLYTVPPAGAFHPKAKKVNWSDTPTAAFLELIEVIEGDNRTTYRNRSYGRDDFVPVNIAKVIKLGQQADGVGEADFHTWRFEGLNLLNTLEADSGRVELIDCAARKVAVHSIDEQRPVLTASNCLFKQVQTARSLTRLEYCTVLESCLSEIIQASDCIFLGHIRKHHPSPAPPDEGCIRYSRIHAKQEQGGMRFSHITRTRPHFFSEKFAERACAVLHPATSTAIRHGAEDGTEMGAYHNRYLSRLAEAVVDKLQDYLPLGVEAVVIPDERMVDMQG